MTNSTLEEIEAAAGKATAGPWEVAGDGDTTFVRTVYPGRAVAKFDWSVRDEIDDTNAAYIALLDPQTVLALISELRALQSLSLELERVKTRAHDLTKGLTRLTAGGSEYFVRDGDDFYADVERCVTYVRERHESIHRNLVEAVTSRLATEAESARLREALSRIVAEDDDFRASMAPSVAKDPVTVACDAARDLIRARPDMEGGKL